MDGEELSLEQHFSKCRPRTSSFSPFWECVRNASSRDLPDLPNWKFLGRAPTVCVLTSSSPLDDSDAVKVWGPLLKRETIWPDGKEHHQMSFGYYFCILSVGQLHFDPFATMSSSRVMVVPVLILTDPNMAKIPISLITQVPGSLVDISKAVTLEFGCILQAPGGRF